MVTAAKRRPVTTAVRRLLDTLTLDEMGDARAAVALALAERLDDIAGATTGAAATAAAGLSRELQVTLEAIMVPADAEDADKFLHEILSTEAT